MYADYNLRALALNIVYAPKLSKLFENIEISEKRTRGETSHVPKIYYHKNNNFLVIIKFREY